MRNDDAAGRQHVLDRSQAQRKPDVQPDRVSDDFSGKTVTTIERITGNF